MDNVTTNYEAASTAPHRLIGIVWPDMDEVRYPNCGKTPRRHSEKNVEALLTHIGVRVFRAGDRTAIAGLHGFSHLDRAAIDVLHRLALKAGLQCKRRWLQGTLHCLAHWDAARCGA